MATTPPQTPASDVPLSADAIIQLVYDQVGGDISFEDTPEHNLPLDCGKHWQNNYIVKSSPRLRQALTKLDSIRELLGQLRYLTNAGVGDLNPQVGVRFTNLSQMEKEAIEDVDYWRKWYAQQAPLAVKQMTAIAPIEPNSVNQCGPNDRRLRGDAFLPPIFREN